MPAHHLTPDYLHNYAVGATSEAFSLIIATHLAMCPACRTLLAQEEAIGGAILADMKPAEASPRTLDAVLKRIGDGGRDKFLPKKASEKVLEKEADTGLQEGDILIPQPLSNYIKARTIRDLDQLKWTKLPGFAEVNLTPEGATAQIKLMRISAGVTMPKHTHTGTEITLVLHGGFADAHGTFGPGDLEIANASIDHAPRADEESDCICLAVLEAPLKFTGVFSRLLNPFMSF